MYICIYERERTRAKERESVCMYAYIHAYIHTCIHTHSLSLFRSFSLFRSLSFTRALSLTHTDTSLKRRSSVIRIRWYSSSECVCMYAYIHACMHTYIHAYTHLTQAALFSHTDTLVLFLRVCVYVCIHTCMHAYIHTCIHTPHSSGALQSYGYAGTLPLSSPWLPDKLAARPGGCEYVYRTLLTRSRPLGINIRSLYTF